MVPAIDVMSDFSMSELVTLSISVVKSIFGMINSSLTKILSLYKMLKITK